MDKAALQKEIERLRNENRLLKRHFFSSNDGSTVNVPEQFQSIFNDAEELVSKYFSEAKANPSKGIIEINDERYVLLRASSLSVDFLNKIKDLYADKGEEEAFDIGRNFLFDIAHVIGLEDAKNFHTKMGVKDPISKLSAGPVHFAYSGWAFVDILPESNPSPNDNFYLKYHHPYSFEADSWVKSGKKSNKPVCIMSAGYSSGWCEESFGISLTSVEISCRAKGDDNCTFIMAPPHKIEDYIKSEPNSNSSDVYDVPLFFERKRAEEAIRESLHEKNILLKEIHHRVKNNLQIISSLLNLQSNYLSDDDSKTLFKETQNRIKTLALVHEKLYKSEDIEYVDISEYIKSIVSFLSYSYNKEYIDVKYDFSDEKLERFDVEKAIPCGLIINEIVSNSFKYAFPKVFQGEVKVTLSKEHKTYVMNVEDNGVGLPENVDFENSESLGMELIYSLVEQLEGEIKVNCKKGTKYQITFP